MLGRARGRWREGTWLGEWNFWRVREGKGRIEGEMMK